MPPPTRITAADYHFYAYNNDEKTPWTLGSAQPDRGALQFYSMVNDLEGLRAYGASRRVPNISLTNAGAGIKVGSNTRYTKVLSFGGRAANSPAVVITGGIHAREWIAPAMAYLLAEYLVMNYQRDHPAQPYQGTLRDLVDNRRIIIAPMLNPHGNSYSVYSPEKDARMWRKNRRALPRTKEGWAAALTTDDAPNPPLLNVNVPAPEAPNLARYDVPVYRKLGEQNAVTIGPGAQFGVDLNRNCSTPAWGHHVPEADGRPGRSGEPGQEDYFGPRRSSERETLNIESRIADAARRGGIGTAIDYHSYGKAIGYPTETGYRVAGLAPGYTALGQILQCLIGPELYPDPYDYQLSRTIEYETVGTIDDHIALMHGARAFVIELDPADPYDSKDPNSGFALPEDQIQSVFEKNIRGALALIAAAGIASQVTNTRTSSRFERRTINSGERVYRGWNVFGRGNRLPT